MITMPSYLTLTACKGLLFKTTPIVDELAAIRSNSSHNLKPNDLKTTS